MSDADLSRKPVSPRFAEGALLLATLVWGSSFAWMKISGDAINRLSGDGAGGIVGPAMLLAARFGLAGILWFAIFPASRRGWSARSVARGALLGSLLSSGLVLQTLGLDRTSEAVSAFLTSLTILWVPLIMTLLLRKPPARVFWIGVILAATGIWLMTGAIRGFGAGELLGLLCSIVFAIHLITLNAVVSKDRAARLTGAQFLVCGSIALLLSLAFPAGRSAWLHAPVAIFTDALVLKNLVLLVLLPTIVSFGLMSAFQPYVDPTRAALIYLTEPIFAAAYAWLAFGRRLGGSELLGAGLILAANALVEGISIRRNRQRAREVPQIDRSRP